MAVPDGDGFSTTQHAERVWSAGRAAQILLMPDLVSYSSIARNSSEKFPLPNPPHLRAPRGVGRSVRAQARRPAQARASRSNDL